MKPSFRILHLEDSPRDCELVRTLLVTDGMQCDVEACDNKERFLHLLQSGPFDLIFADCTLPQFNGLHALELARRHAPETPFIFVSGTLDEELAIESLRSGATDYVLKDRLSRLVPAVRRALNEAEERSKSLEMEQHLRQSQRLEAVGTLAGGIAHDFNNILTIIKGYTSLLPMEAGRPDRVKEIASTIDRASLRGSELVNQLLAFARKTDGSLASTEMNQRVREITSMLRLAMPQNITFELDLDDTLPEIDADAGQIERVIINLSTNARDAMPKGGKITYSTSRVPGDALPVHVSSQTTAENRAREYLCLRVTDTGSGMDEQTRQRIFEPFFTTKPRGKGTGLGMPVVYGLMQSHRGLIDIQSALGKGTSISLYFPISSEPLPRAVIQPLDNPARLDGTETILVVDDEPDVRQFLEVILQAHGYSVQSARDAEAALELLARPGPGIDLLFSDIGLTKLDGFDLSHRAQGINPRLKIVLCSGYMDATIKNRMIEQDINGFIPKPYDANALLKTIRAVLDKEPRGSSSASG